MADERDPQVSKRYRELGAEEPPRALDEAILAASRKGLKRRTWYGPVALAASLVLVVAVAVQVERQRPDEAVVATAPQPRMNEQAASEARKEKIEPFAQQAPAGARGPAASPATPPAQAAPPPQPAPAPAPREEALRDLAKTQAPRAAEAPAASARSDAAEKRAPAAVAAMAVLRPEPWLEQIAELRRQGRHEEADKALAEFRKRYPDYPLTDEIKAKVEKK